MSPQLHLQEKFSLDSVDTDKLAEARQSYMAECRRELNTGIVLYILGALCLALLGSANGKESLVYVSVFVALVAGLAYQCRKISLTKDFDRATRPVSFDSLPKKLVLLQENSPLMQDQLRLLLQKQNQEVYRFQINALYDLEHNQRIGALRSALY